MVKKTKFKLLLALMLVILLVSTCCYATEPADSTEGTEETPGVTLSQEDSESLLSGSNTSTDAPTTTTEQPDWTYSDLFKCDQDVVVDGVIDGNAFIIGQEVTIKGEIGGDLFVMAQKLNIDGGYVYSSIFAMAEEITMNGISYDLYAMCSSFKLESNGFVYRDFKVAGNDLSLAGKIRRDAYIVANKLTFDETVGTVVYGDLNYTSGAAEYTAPEGTVAGEVKYTQDTTETPSVEVDKDAVAKVSIGAIIIGKVKDLLSKLVTTLFVALFLVFVVPKFLKKFGEMGTVKTVIAGLTSVINPIIIPVVLGIICIILIIVTGILQVVGIGLSVSAVIFSLFLTLAVIATAVTCVYFGKLFAKLIKKESKLFTILFALLVALVLWVISLIPFIGGLVGYLAAGFGEALVLVNLLPNKKAKTEKAE